MLGEPITIDGSENGTVEQTEEYGTCPECGGRGAPCGETAIKAFLKCEYCGVHFSEGI